LRESIHVAPVLRPGGWLLLLALIRWRTPEGRLLAALACVPQTGGLYDTLPLFLTIRHRAQGYALAALGFVPAVLIASMRRHPLPLAEELAREWPTLLPLYLAALGFVLWPALQAWRVGRGDLIVPR
jgi:hypothetical protein